MCLASGGYSKMSCFNAQILLRGPRAFFFFWHGKVCGVSGALRQRLRLDGGASFTATRLCFSHGSTQHSILFLYCIQTCIFPIT